MEVKKGFENYYKHIVVLMLLRTLYGLKTPQKIFGKRSENRLIKWIARESKLTHTYTSILKYTD